MKGAGVKWSFEEGLCLFLTIGHFSGDLRSGELLKLAREGRTPTDSKFMWLFERYSPTMVELMPAVQEVMVNDDILYETTFAALNLTNQLNDAEVLWTEVQKQAALGRRKVTQPICNAMMGLYVKNNQPKQLITLTQKLSFWKLPQKSGLGFIVSMVSKLNDTEKLNELLSQMGNQGFILDVDTSDELGIHYLRTKQVSKIYELIRGLRYRGYTPGSFLLSWLVYTNIERGDMDEAVQYWAEMQEHKIPPHGILGPYHLLIHHHAQLHAQKFQLELPTPSIEQTMSQFFLLPEAATSPLSPKYKEAKEKWNQEQSSRAKKVKTKKTTKHKKTSEE
eukprot:TRINITY_DN663_c0_g1_i1.p1 TRINITY_DN663_c0_g1~~TRINITY_DN663_c0_g1_i1.p1  ORF type:complete len:386 (+),score=56.24 TRINITY_DN663_c0_g1_i1:154-1158(+)